MWAIGCRPPTSRIFCLTLSFDWQMLQIAVAAASWHPDRQALSSVSIAMLLSQSIMFRLLQTHLLVPMSFVQDMHLITWLAAQLLMKADSG